MKVFDVRYREVFEGIFGVEAETPEEAEARFREEVAANPAFGERVGRSIEAAASSAKAQEAAYEASTCVLPRNNG